MVKIKKTLSKKENKFLEMEKQNFEKELLTHPKDCDDRECIFCGYRDCPNHEPLHYHHDGCPACYTLKKEKKCKMCYGYGWYPIGNLTPIGELDSREWDKLVIKCPWCGAGFVKDKDRYVLLEGEKRRMEK